MAIFTSAAQMIIHVMGEDPLIRPARCRLIRLSGNIQCLLQTTPRARFHKRFIFSIPPIHSPLSIARKDHGRWRSNSPAGLERLESGLQLVNCVHDLLGRVCRQRALPQLGPGSECADTGECPHVLLQRPLGYDEQDDEPGRALVH